MNSMMKKFIHLGTQKQEFLILLGSANGWSSHREMLLVFHRFRGTPEMAFPRFFDAGKVRDDRDILLFGVVTVSKYGIPRCRVMMNKKCGAFFLEFIPVNSTDGSGFN